jgi:hypothetical protein
MHNANSFTCGIAALTIVPSMQASIIQQNIAKQSVHSTSRTLYHDNELFSAVYSNLFPTFSHKLIPRSFPVKLLTVTSQACTCKGVLLYLLSNQDTQIIQAQSYLLLDY